MAAEAVHLIKLGRKQAMLRGPTGIVGLIVTIVVIYLILRLLGVL